MAGPIISILPATGLAGDNLTFTVLLSEPSARAVVVDWRAIDGSAKLFDDYFPERGVVTIAAGQTSATFRVGLVGTNVGETNEGLQIELSNPQGGVFAGDAPLLRTTGVIMPDEDEGPGLFVSAAFLNEGDAGATAASFQIVLSEPAATNLSFSYATVDGTAKAGSDYVAERGVVTFRAGQTVATVDIAVKGDRAFESAESFSLVVKPSSTTASTFADAVADAVIVSDEGAPPIISILPATGLAGDGLTFTVLLSEPSARAVVVDWRAIDGSAKLFDDYFPERGVVTIAAGQTSATFRVGLVGTNVGETNEGLQIELSNPQGGVFAGDAPLLRTTGVIMPDEDEGPGLFVSAAFLNEGDAGATAASFQIVLSEPAATNLSFSYATVDGTAKAGSDYVAERGVVTFRAGQTVATVDIAVKGDRAFESAESFSLVVKPSSTTASTFADAVADAVIVSDEGAPPIISILPATGLAGDGLTFTVLLSEPSARAVVVDWRAIDGSAKLFDDYFPERGVVTIAAGQTSATFRVGLVGTNVGETNEGLQIELSNPQGGVFAGDAPLLRTTGVIMPDEDEGPGLFVSDAFLNEGDAGATAASFQIVLSEPAATNLSFSYATVDGTAKAGSDYVAERGVVTFRAGQTVATVDIAVKGDRAFESAESFSLVVRPNNSVSNPETQVIAVATVENEDDINETLRGDDRPNMIKGGDGADRIDGLGAADNLYGDAANDTLFGGAGDDGVFGGAGDDALTGGDGADRLLGGLGRDQATGGAGRDTFVFATIRDSGALASDRDVIRDFDGRVDTLDLSALDANTARTGNQAFRFIDDDAFSGAAGQLRFTNGLLFADVNGDRTADFAVQLLGRQDLSASDFML